MKWKELSRNDVVFYKAIGILLIVTHNFMHWLPGPKEMEFNFEPTSFFEFLTFMVEQPERLIQVLLSYLGHFGVQIFIFISAYGLTKKFLLGTPRYQGFIFSRLLSIYPSFLLAIFFWAVVKANYDYGWLAPIKYLYWNLEGLIYKVTLLSNFFEAQRLNLVGPWWFISFIFQFYLVFPLMFLVMRRFQSKGLLLITCAAFVALYSTDGTVAGVSLSYTVIGHLPEFCLGMYLASKDQKPMSFGGGYFVAAIAVFVLGNVRPELWYFTHLSFLIVLLFLFNAIVPKLSNVSLMGRSLFFIGGLSMYLFLVNGFLRKPFVKYAIADDTWWSALRYCVISLLLSIIVAILLSKAETVVRWCSAWILSKLSPRRVHD